MSPGRKPHIGSSPLRQSSTRFPLLSWYQEGKPFSALTGPTAVRPPGFFTLTPVVANALVLAARGRATMAAAAIARRDQRPFRPPARCLGGPLTRWVLDMVPPRGAPPGRVTGAVPRRVVAGHNRSAAERRGVAAPQSGGVGPSA